MRPHEPNHHTHTDPPAQAGPGPPGRRDRRLLPHPLSDHGLAKGGRQVWARWRGGGGVLVYVYIYIEREIERESCGIHLCIHVQKDVVCGI